MKYIIWLVPTILCSIAVWRLNWRTANIFRQEFFRDGVRSIITVLLLTAMIVSLLNFLMCFADEATYEVEKVEFPYSGATDVMDSNHAPALH